MGAQCLPCKVALEEMGAQLQPGGTCLADMPSILTHVKSCDKRDRTERKRAEVELKALRERKKSKQSGES